MCIRDSSYGIYIDDSYVISDIKNATTRLKLAKNIIGNFSENEKHLNNMAHINAVIAARSVMSVESNIIHEKVYYIKNNAGSFGQNVITPRIYLSSYKIKQTGDELKNIANILTFTISDKKYICAATIRQNMTNIYAGLSYAHSAIFEADQICELFDKEATNYKNSQQKKFGGFITAIAQVNLNTRGF